MYSSKNETGDIYDEEYIRFATPGEVGMAKKCFQNTTLSPTEMSFDFLYTPPSGTVEPARKVEKIDTPLVKRTVGTASEGTFVQLLSRGPQDVYLTYNPEMSLFKRVYKRYTNFAVEQSEEKFPTTVRFGTKNTITVSKRGDLIGSMILRVVLPNLNISGGTWVDTMGYNIIAGTVLRIGDTRIQPTEGLWLDIDDKLFCPDSQFAGISKLVKRGEVLATDQAHEILIPLKFFCCKNTTSKQQFIPTYSLATNINVYVDFTFKTLVSLVNLPANTQLPDNVSLTAGLIVEYTFLDEAEKYRFAQTPTSITFDRVFSIDKNTYLTTTNGQVVNQSKVDIDLRELNKPVKYFAIVAYPENDITGFEYTNIFEKGTFYINSNQQFSPRNGEYFSIVQKYQHFRRCNPSDNILVYSFALDATSFQPNGSLNFAPYTKSKLSFDIVPQINPKKIKVFAVTIDFLVFENGMCRLLFT
jgi:hypothetical protein